ncbi:MAG: hypothetical protein M0R02_12960 [Bacteroidales bacterium]|nr:hypothetical protein [Bacteroidales bacterium]
MTITLGWWAIPLALFFAPFLYSAIFGDDSGYAGLDIGSMIVLLVCWVAAIAVIIGRFIAP